MPKSPDLYSVHPSVQMVEDWIAALKGKTGRSLDEWLRFIKKEGPATEGPRRTWLKDKHGLGTSTAWWLAQRSVGKGGDDTPEGYLKAAPRYVEEMYAGKKAALKPRHDKLIALGRSLGKDVKVCPCQTIVPLYRSHVFAQVKPSTNTRIDFGLCLTPLLKEGKKKFPARLIDTGGFAKKDRITHRFAITDVKDIDTEVKEWLTKAYDLDS